MLALAELTKPGPFGRRTHELGIYLGIRCRQKLAAMVGERLRVPGYTEISAVCTHPDYAGRGYASALIAGLLRRIHAPGRSCISYTSDLITSARSHCMRGLASRRALPSGSPYCAGRMIKLDSKLSITQV